VIEFLAQYITADRMGHVLAGLVVATVLGVASVRHRMAPEKESTDA
jgi:hypothetical protein